MATDSNQGKPGSGMPQPPTPYEKGTGQGIRVFSYPKIIFLYPSCIASLLCGFLMLIFTEDPNSIQPSNLNASKQTTTPSTEQPEPNTSEAAVEADATTEDGTEAGEPADEDAEAMEANESTEAEAEPEAVPASEEASSEKKIRPQTVLSIFFLGVLGFNLLVMALDFPRFTAIAGALLLVAVVLFMIVLSQAGFKISVPFLAIIQDFNIQANASFYFAFFFIQLTVYLTIYFTRFLDYYEITPNEILHHHGPLSDLERYPTLHLKFEKEIPDIFEFALAGAGRLILYLPNETPIILENVLFINKVEDHLKNLMGQLSVRIDTRG